MRASVLMMQGTTSSAGKSLMVTALCRILHQDGYRVAPFKAQNMALNSYVTEAGEEMGRAQVVQAFAAGVEPIVDMNPILLKPEGHGRSQIVLRGRPAGHLETRTYSEQKRSLWPAVADALDRLRAEYDVVIIEGAGSPAEINLRDGDIVNMRVARHAQAPVLLVGDIDRGGVFAALVGTLELLLPEERDLVRGLVINKFRGDVGLLQPALEFVEQRTGKPVMGVVPYIPRLLIAEEDAVALDGAPTASSEGPLEIDVIHLPHISNFDDFDLLAAEPAVTLRYVGRPEEIGRPDLVIIPGTKTTANDLSFVRTSGLAGRIERLARAGTPVLGICGGFQMLGERLSDPEGVESDVPETPGLGLLPGRTVFLPDKRTRRVRASPAGSTPLLDGLPHRFTGYEIHMGMTETPAAPLFQVEDGSGESHPDGAVSEDGLVAGTYLHGLFETPEVRSALIASLGRRRGLQLEGGVIPSREAEYDRLAGVVRENLDMAAIYRLLKA